MSTQFDDIILKMKPEQSLMYAMLDALKKKGQADRMNSDHGIFIIDDVTVQSVEGGEVTLKVQYEYGG